MDGIVFIIINYLVFAGICLVGLKHILTTADTFKNPFSKQEIVPTTGIHSFLLLTLMTGIFMTGNVSALRLLVWILFFLICIFRYQSKILFTPTVLLYTLFLSWLIVAISYSPTKVFGVRVFLKYLYPFLVLCLATQITNSYLFYTKGIKGILRMAIWGAFAYFILYKIPFISSILSYLLWNFPAYLDFIPVAIAISLTIFSFSKKTKYLFLAIFFLSFSIIAVNRTGLIGATIAFLAYFLIRHKVKSLPYISFFLILFAAIILYVPSFRDKMFKKQLSADQILEERESMTSEDIDSSGRFAMWDWSLNRFYKNKEVMGSGLGVLQETFYTYKHPFGKIRIVHNDYVQLLCDTGLIGITLYGLTLLSLIIHSGSIYLNKRNTSQIRFAALIAFIGMTGITSTLFTDNVVNYSLLTLSYPFGLYGMLIGLKKSHQTNLVKP